MNKNLFKKKVIKIFYKEMFKNPLIMKLKI